MAKNGGETTQGGQHLEKVAAAVAEVQKAATVGLDNPVVGLESNTAAIYKNLESTAERATALQIDRLHELRKQIDDMEEVQLAHLARVKADLQMLLRNG